MLFNSFLFLLLFLPLVLSGYFLCVRIGHRVAMAWLVGASLLFYGWWTPAYLILLCCSILFNYTAGVFIQKTSANGRVQMIILASGITLNLLLLCYYKYLFPILHWFEKLDLYLIPANAGVLLPLGISFFTFTQIGYLIDCKAGLASGRRFLDYTLFVTFFPHLIAGPILHHREMMPQFENRETWRFDLNNFTVGLCIFSIGLAKKTIVADRFSDYVNTGFNALGQLSSADAWMTMLSYSMQLYFDFSGYSEMAIGLALLFNIRFPANFDSPYKSGSIIEFWQRWHMTLTRYLNLYLYNPVALWVTRLRTHRGMPVGRPGLKTLSGFLSMVAFPTVFTMVLAGIWHGAGLQFLIWGLLHACYLIINHIWRLILHKKNAKNSPEKPNWFSPLWKIAVTYCSVLFAQIFFRCPSITDSLTMISTMIGHSHRTSVIFDHPLLVWTYITVGFLVVLGTPNTLQVFSKWEPTLSKLQNPFSEKLALFQWKPSIFWAVVVGVVSALAILGVGGATEFLYFRF